MDSSVFLDFLGKRKPPPAYSLTGSCDWGLSHLARLLKDWPELELPQPTTYFTAKENQPLTRAVSRGGWCLSSVRVNPNGVKEYVWRLSSILSLRFQVVLRHPGEVDSAVFSEEVVGEVVRRGPDTRVG